MLYPRVSSLKQVSNDSLATQRRVMQRFAEQHGYEVVRIFEDRGKSAKTANRPALREMLDWISEQGGKIYAVLVLDYNRAAKNVQDHFAIRAMRKTQGSRLISITQPVSEDAYGRFSEVIFAGIAELEKAIRGDRSKLGMVSATKRGRWCHQAPVGYVNCGRNAVPSLSHDPERADVVRATFTRIASGEAPQSVYAELVERGFGTRRGGIIGRQTFYSVLRNPVYCGQLVTKLGSVRVIGNHLSNRKYGNGFKRSYPRLTVVVHRQRRGRARASGRISASGRALSYGGGCDVVSAGRNSAGA